jgi:hypothetical protein
MARCGCGSTSGGVLVSGTNTVVTGSGTPASPYQVAAHTSCAEARLCVSAGNGITYTSGTGVIAAKLSTTAGNGVTFGVDGGLYISPNNNTVTTGPGILGNGSVGNTVRANVSAWPFPSTADLGGSGVYVDSTGLLRASPDWPTYYFESTVTRNFTAPALAVPTAALANIDSPFTFSVTNPNSFRSVMVVSDREFDAKLTMPAGGAASIGVDGLEVYRMMNTGAATTMTGIHSYVSRTVQESASLAPGASILLSMQPMAGAGAASSLISQFVMAFRVRMFTL